MGSIKLVEEGFKSDKQLPKFAPGDTIVVDYRTKEGDKERIQKFRGTVIRISGRGDQRRFTVCKISDGVGVERISPYNSPFIEEIRVERHGKVRRAKLYYLRNLRGEAARIRERRTLSTSVK